VSDLAVDRGSDLVAILLCLRPFSKIHKLTAPDAATLILGVARGNDAGVGAGLVAPLPLQLAGLVDCHDC
jgi:hypothetical protein